MGLSTSDSASNSHRCGCAILVRPVEVSIESVCIPGDVERFGGGVVQVVAAIVHVVAAIVHAVAAIVHWMQLRQQLLSKYSLVILLSYCGLLPRL